MTLRRPRVLAWVWLIAAGPGSVGVAVAETIQDVPECMDSPSFEHVRGGQPCENGEGCDSDVCWESLYCADFCVETCPGLGCQVMQEYGKDPVFLCLPVEGGLAWPCEANSDCAVGWCPENGVCEGDCSADDCLAAWACVPSPADERQDGTGEDSIEAGTPWRCALRTQVGGGMADLCVGGSDCHDWLACIDDGSESRCSSPCTWNSASAGNCPMNLACRDVQARAGPKSATPPLVPPGPPTGSRNPRSSVGAVR
jgi:hypothetical protein